jgi:probable addiction module antidote protein
LLYLTECFNDEYEETFLVALKDVVMAYGGVAKIAKASGLNRESLYKVLSRGGNPEVNTLRKILAALKMKIVFAKA